MEGGREERQERKEDTTDHMSATDDVTLTYLPTDTPPTHHLATSRQCRTGQVHIMTNSQLLYM